MPPESTPPAAKSEVQMVQELKHAAEELHSEMAKVIVGQRTVVRQLLTCLFCRGHCLMIGVPGLAKTLMVSTLARALGWKFKRIQFTPDLMPSDIMGTEILRVDPDTGERRYEFVPGPLFANLVLADEINRTPPRTQSAMLEAMQEQQVTVGATTHPLTKPFFVVATQNPIEQEGVYPLPEAQLDRFMFSVNLDYPARNEEVAIVDYATGAREPDVKQVFDPEYVMECQNMVRRLEAPRAVVEYAVDIARNTRPLQSDSMEFIDEYVEWGAGPRASMYLMLGAKAWAALDGRPMPTAQDVRDMAPLVLRHRVLPSYAAAGERIGPDHIIRRVLGLVAEPKGASEQEALPPPPWAVQQ
jgi:MoxR-like ATPase